MSTCNKIVAWGGILIFTLSACNSKKTEAGDTVTQLSLVEEAKVKSVNTSQVFSSVKCVPLDTDDAYLVGEIVKAKHKDHFIYVADAHTLYKFDEGGNFIGKINRAGQGPGEYLYISDFEIENEENVWILSSSKRSLYKYNWNGELLKELKQDYRIDKMLLLSPNKMFLYIGNILDKDNQHQVKILDLETDSILANLLEVNPTKAKFLHVMADNHYAKGAGGTAYFYNMFDETIYAILDGKVSPIFRIDIYGKNVPASFFDAEYEDVRDFFQTLFTRNYAYGSPLFVEGKDRFLYAYFYQREYHVAIISKETGKAVVDFEEMIEDTALSGYPFDFTGKLICGQMSNEIIIPLQPFEIMEYAATVPGMEGRIKDAIKYKGEDQNPVLLLLTI